MALSTYIFGLEKVLRSNFYVQAFARNAMIFPLWLVKFRYEFAYIIVIIMNVI